MNSTLETQLNHRSIRAFKNTAFSEETLNTLIQVAQRTATSSGHQAASILRITDPSEKEAIAKICNQAYVATGAELWIFLVDQKRNHDLTLATGADASNAGSFSRFIQGFTDAILMAQNVVIAAESLDIGTVYLGSIHNDIPQLNTLLNLPDYSFAAVGLAMGYPDQDPELKPRMDMTLRIYENNYPNKTYTLEDFKAYDEHLATYYDLRNANTRVDSFSKQISKRYSGSSGRDNFLVEILKRVLSKMDYHTQIQEAAAYLKDKIKHPVSLSLVLGSGLGDVSKAVENSTTIPYQDIPHFPVSTVSGHAGSLLFGDYKGHSVVFMQGRFHYYEGYSMKEVVFPFYVLKELGVKTTILTNACGGINTNYKPGDIVVIEDFINLVIQNPLIGINDERLGPRFPDMTEPYDETLRALAQSTAKALNLPYQTGVYGFFSGPYYETKAEIRAYGKMGCDLIGMSTVPETIALNHMGVKVLAFAVVTNMATGIQKKKHSHAHVIEMAKQASTQLSLWLDAVLENL